MNCVDSVFELSEKFMKDPTHVLIDYNEIQNTTLLMTDVNTEKIHPTPPSNITHEEIKKECYLQLLGGSINYCYWYGKYNIRQNNCSSTKMFSVILKTAENYNVYSKEFKKGLQYNFSKERFTLLEERISHLNETFKHGEEFIDIIINSNHRKSDISLLLEYMIQIFPGYSSDMFLKRASLFFLILFRKFGWFEKAINKLPIPTDYQIPKMFNYFKCLRYDKILTKKINNHELIPKGSLMECEIRAATILIAKQLCEITGWNISDVDYWFWGQRKNYDIPFHLTITTDY